MQKTTPDLSQYECGICQMILEQPTKLRECAHCFCKECILRSIKVQTDNEPNRDKYQCPLCRLNFTKKDMTINKQLQNKLHKEKVKCKCAEKIPLTEYNKHIEECPAHIAEIKASIKDTTVKDAKKTVNRSTFTCTVCQEKNLDRKGLISHVKANHPTDEAVCPICLSQPWGDPNYKTFLKGHLKMRHMFDYDTTVDYNNEEDDVLAKVLQDSLNEK